MKVILNVSKHNQYADRNGKVFEVRDTITIKGKTVYGLLGVDPLFLDNVTDFLENEVIVKPFEIYGRDEIQTVYERHYTHPGSIVYSENGYEWKSVPMDSGKWNNKWYFSFIK